MFLQFLNSFLNAIRFACIRVASSSAQMTGATRDSLFFQLSVQDHQAVLELLFLEDAQVVETKESVHDAKVLLHALLGDLPSILELSPTLAHLVALETLFQRPAGFQGISQGQDLDMRCNPPVAIAPW
jgi:hypothetical protein